MSVRVALHGIDDARLVADQLAVWFGDRAEVDAPAPDTVTLEVAVGPLRPPVEAASVALAEVRVALVQWGHDVPRVTAEAGELDAP